jgi:nucleotide-binding universal stress UspA family protein
MRIAVGVDGSAQSRRALELVAVLAAALDAHVDVIHARSLAGYGPGLDRAPADQMSETVAALEEQAQHECAEVLGRRIHWAFAGRHGRPAEVLLGYLRETSVDLLVVGHRPDGDGSSLDSTPGELINAGSVPVLVVP